MKRCKRGHLRSPKNVAKNRSCKKCLFFIRISNPKRWLYYGAKNNARNWGYEFSLTINDIPETPEFCPVFPWIKIKRHIDGKKGGWHFDSPTIDRIDSNKGYVVGNVRIISWRANELKKNGILREFEALVEDCKNTGRLD